MNIIRKYPLYLLLFPLFFCLHGIIENFGFVEFKDMFFIFLQITISILFSLSLIFLITKNLNKASFFVFVFFVWYCFFGAIKDFISNYSLKLSGYSVLVPILIFLNIAILVFFRKKNTLHQNICIYLNMLLIIYCFVDGSIFLYKTIFKEQNKIDNLAFQNSRVKNKPNFYFLLFDEYAGFKSLKDSFSFSNSVFYDSLKLNNFKELPVFANYSMTAYSMASILNMDYIKKVEENKKVKQKDVQNRYKEIMNAEVFNSFSSIGYEVINYSIFDLKNQKSLGGNSFILGNKRLLQEKLLHNRLIKDLGWIFLNGKYSFSIFKDLYYGDIEDYNKKVENLLDNNITNGIGKPKFVYAHFLIPHQPYFFDSNGVRNKNLNLNEPNVLANKEIYLSYLKYCNKKILKTINKIIKYDKNAIVLLMSDHGFRNYKDFGNFEPYNFDNFCFIRNVNQISPDLKSSFSNVNVFRYVLNENFNQQFSYLKDSLVLLNELKK
jgi:hypothetical protein